MCMLPQKIAAKEQYYISSNMLQHNIWFLCFMVTLVASIFKVSSTVTNQHTADNRIRANALREGQTEQTVTGVQQTVLTDAFKTTKLPNSIPKWCHLLNGSVTCVSKKSDIKIILQQIPTGIEEINLVIEDKSFGEFPANKDIIDLSPMSRLTGLKRLHLDTNLDEKFMVNIKVLKYDNETFTKMTFLEEIRINIALNDKTDLQRMFDSKVLHKLDLSNTATLGYQSVENILSSMNKTCLNTLLLSNFQTIGSRGYSATLKMEAFFENSSLPNLHGLDLSKNGLGNIFSGLASTLPHLKWLNLSYNLLILPTNTQFFLDTFLHPSLEDLNIAYQGSSSQYLTQPGRRLCKGTHCTSPDTSIQNERMFYEHAYHCFNLYTKNISATLNSDRLMRKIVSCVTGYNIDAGFLHLCRTIRRSYDSNCIALLNIPFFLKTQRINADSLNWLLPSGFQIKGTLCLQNNALEEISFRNNPYWFQNEFLSQDLNLFLDIRGLDNVEIIDISYNEASIVLPLNIKSHFPKVRKVYMINNKVTFRNVSICHMLPKLQLLNVNWNKLTDFNLPSLAISNCSNLEEVILSNNSLTLTSTTLVISRNHQLRKLDLSNNGIRILPRSLQRDLDSIAEVQLQEQGEVLVAVTLSGNHLLCSCNKNALLFAEWLLKTKVRLEISEKVLCNGKHGLQILELKTIEEMRHSCSDIALIVTSVTVTISTSLVLFLSTAAYMFRWKIRYNLHKIVEKVKCVLSGDHHDDQSNHWKYDGYVSYSMDDRFWVHDVLGKTLQKKYGFNLCTGLRDFKAGNSLADEIVKCMKQSKYLMVVLSKTYINEPWCQFEVENCLREALERRIRVIAIKLGQFPIPSDEPIIKWIMENQVYLPWSSKKEAQEFFWRKLVNHLYSKSENYGSEYCSCFIWLGDYKAVNALTDEDSEGKETDPLLPINR